MLNQVFLANSEIVCLTVVLDENQRTTKEFKVYSLHTFNIYPKFHGSLTAIGLKTKDINLLVVLVKSSQACHLGTMNKTFYQSIT